MKVFLKSVFIIWLSLIALVCALDRARGCEPPVPHVNLREARLQKLFETCRDTRGGEAQRKCEAEYFAFVAANWSKK